MGCSYLDPPLPTKCTCQAGDGAFLNDAQLLVITATTARASVAAAIFALAVFVPVGAAAAIVALFGRRTYFAEHFVCGLCGLMPRVDVTCESSTCRTLLPMNSGGVSLVNLLLVAGIVTVHLRLSFEGL